jgi:hypothetical protein
MLGLLAARDQAGLPYVNITRAQLFHCATNNFSYKRPHAQHCGRERQLIGPGFEGK